MELREYQKNAINIIKEDFYKGERLNKYIVMPCGTGKTEVFKNITDNKILILTKSISLSLQTRDRFKLDISDHVLSIGNGNHLTQELLNNSTDKIVVATIQTLEKDIEYIDPNSFELIVIDECHHTEGDPRYKKIIDHLNYKLCLGVTATPPKLSSIFKSEDKIYEMDIFEAWRDGWLMKPTTFKCELKYNFTSLQQYLGKNMENKEFLKESLEESFSAYLSENFEIILNMLNKICNCEKAAVFFPTIKLAEEFTEYCQQQKIECYTISSKTCSKKRKEILTIFQKNRNVILSNVLVLTEGIDIPDLETIFVARPIRNKNHAKQLYGRCMRISNEKTNCNIIDSIIESSDYIYHQTFETAYFPIPLDEFKVGYDKNIIDMVEEQINDSVDYEQLKEDLKVLEDIKIELSRTEHVDYDTANFTNYIIKKDFLCGKVSVLYMDKYTGEIKDKYTTYLWYILDQKNHDIKLYKGREDKKSKENIFHFIGNSNTECFKKLNNYIYKIYDDIDRYIQIDRMKRGQRTLCTIKQQNKIHSYMFKITDSKFKDFILSNWCKTMSKKQASIIIDNFILESIFSELGPTC